MKAMALEEFIIQLGEIHRMAQEFSYNVAKYLCIKESVFEMHRHISVCNGYRSPWIFDTKLNVHIWSYGQTRDFFGEIFISLVDSKQI